jgi:two-component system, sensor histidine kinase and response regulator
MRAVVEDDLRTERLDRLLAGAGHQLRTPLNSVLGFTEILLMGLPGPLNEEQRRQLRNVRSGARLLETTIDNLLDLMRIESGSLNLRLELVDVGSVVNEVYSNLQHIAKEKGLSLDMEIPTGMTWCTNRRALSRILVNLASNALSFTDTGGVQILGVLGDGVAPARVDIVDTGIGLPETERERLFEPFERRSARSEGGRGGAGLGLDVSRRLADLLGADIAAESALGQGSTFSLILSRRD